MHNLFSCLPMHKKEILHIFFFFFTFLIEYFHFPHSENGFKNCADIEMVGKLEVGFQQVPLIKTLLKFSQYCYISKEK